MTVQNDIQSQFLKQDALESKTSQPVFLSKVEVTGGDNFSRQFFAKLLTPLVAESDYTVGQLINRVDEVYGNLVRTQVFKKILPSLHVDYVHGVPNAKSYNKGKPIVTKVLFDLVADEKSGGNARLAFNNEDNLAVGLGYTNNNFNHNAEDVEIGVDYRPYKPLEHLVSTLRLVLNLRNPAFKFALDLYNFQANNQVWQQNNTHATGGQIGVQYQNISRSLSVYYGFGLAKRSVYAVEDTAPDSVKVFGGDYLKSLLLGRLEYLDVSKLLAFTTDGFKATLKGEISSEQEQGPSTALNSFGKAQGFLDLYKSVLGNLFTLQLSLEGGAIFGNQNVVHVSDRFYLGGFRTFKGFARNSLNEEGGSQYWKAGATLFSAVPLKGAERPLRAYATTSLGCVGDNLLKDSSALSSGFGLRYFNEWVSLDAGYYLARRLGTDSDYGVRNGFQLELLVGGSLSA